jgi:predicted O-linked N-acetylglucosamine transferase (SPINDLY family)
MIRQVNETNASSQLFAEAAAKSVARQLTIVDLFKHAATLETQGQRLLALDLYKTWIAHNGEHELLYAVYFNYGVALMGVGDRAGAILAYRESIRLKPDFHSSYINLGRAFEDSGQAGQAVAQWIALINQLSAINGAAVSHKLTALEQIGRVLEAANTDEPAEDALKQSLDINPAQTKVVQHWISLRQRQCKWPVIEPWERVSRKDLLNGISSLSLECLADDPMFQLAKAYHYAKSMIGKVKPVAHNVLPFERYDQRRLRIGYISSDLREHAVGFGMAEVFDLHNRDSFEIFAYYSGIERTDSTQQRIMRGVDHWVDIRKMSDDAAAARIAADNIDIIVDLNGYTKDARTEVFARRPAPIAVNWYGFPGTMGTPYHHYIIADPYIIPAGHEIYFSEKVLRMPCYQPNDRKRPVAARPSRADAGLPEDAFVYCSLNGMQKLTPRVFLRWMEILRRVPNSVLWLLTGTADVNERLRKLAAQEGVSPQRLVFAQKKANPEHLARYPLADLFLDNSPYGAHTTASDALWMGVPILTAPGRSFAARVCGSLVRAAGVPELECATPEVYVERAVEFGLHRERLAAISAKLAAAREKSLLFDTPQLVGNLEDLYRQMWSDYTRGALPVPDLRNLDIYHEIGTELDIENLDLLSDEAYRAIYKQKLVDWNASYPIVTDGRFWAEAEPNTLQELGPRAVA